MISVCAAEKAEFSKLAGELPRAQHLLGQASTLIQPVGWLLGVDGPRHFLVQTLDDTELRRPAASPANLESQPFRTASYSRSTSSMSMTWITSALAMVEPWTRPRPRTVGGRSPTGGCVIPI